MQQIQAALTAFTRRSGSIRVSHRQTQLSRGLDLGDQILVHDPATDTHMVATVAEVDFELADTSYRLSLGREITAGEAAEWMTPVPVQASHRLSTRNIMTMLDLLRDGGLDVAAAIAD